MITLSKQMRITVLIFRQVIRADFFCKYIADLSAVFVGGNKNLLSTYLLVVDLL